MDGDVLAWELTDDGATVERIEDDTPMIYVAADTEDRLTEARQHHRGLPPGEQSSVEQWPSGSYSQHVDILRVGVHSPGH